MFNSIFRKVLRDFVAHWGRSLLTVLGLAIGLFGVSSVITAFVILSDDMTENFVSTNPPNVTVISSELDAETAATLGTIPGAIESEERRTLFARMQIGTDRWLPVEIQVVEDFGNMRIATFTPQAGLWPASEEGFLLERDGRWFIPDAFGAAKTIRLPNGQDVQLVYEGMVHDAGQAQSRMEGLAYIYINRSTYNSWGLEGSSRTLITVSDPDLVAGGDNRTEAQRRHNVPTGMTNAEFVAAHAEPVLTHYNEVWVSSVVEVTNEHPHQFHLRSIAGLLIGVLATSVILCAALVINLADSIMTAEMRQIGVMKALGGSKGQILRSYIVGIGAIGLLASLFSLSYSISFGQDMAHFIASALNFDILTEGAPLWLVPLIIGVGILTPISVAWLRIQSIAGVSVREALQSDKDIQLAGAGASLLSRLSFLPLIPRMAMRNLARNPRRTLLTIFAVSLGLVTFLAAMNLRTSLLETIVAIDRTQLNDMRLATYEQADRAEFAAFFEQFDNIEKVELWQARVVQLAEVGSRLGVPQTTYLVPANTDMIALDLMRGTWLDNERPSEIVVNQSVVNAVPGLDVGSVMELRVEGWSGVVSIVGVVKEFGGETVYVPESLGAQWGEDAAYANIAFVRLEQSSLEAQALAIRQIEAAFEAEPSLTLAFILTKGALQRGIEAHIDILVQVINVIAAAMLSVGALGLAASVGVSVMERTREIGVLKAVGGGTGAIRNLFVWEAVFIALLGWAAALIMAPIPSRAISSTFGILMLEYPFDYQPALMGPPIALGVAVGIAALMSFFPARSATRISVQSALQSI